MIDINTETILSLSDASKRLPKGRNGAKPHLSTLLRWVQDGLLGGNGQRIHLDAVRLGGRWVTSSEALQRFADRLTAAEFGEAKTHRTAASRQRRKQMEKAEKTLDEEKI